MRLGSPRCGGKHLELSTSDDPSTAKHYQSNTFVEAIPSCNREAEWGHSPSSRKATHVGSRTWSFASASLSTRTRPLHLTRWSIFSPATNVNAISTPGRKPRSSTMDVSVCISPRTTLFCIHLLHDFRSPPTSISWLCSAWSILNQSRHL